MSRGWRRFDIAELDGTVDDGDPADVLQTARALESMVAGDQIAPTVGFEDRVMDAITVEPTPRLAVVPRGRGITARLAALPTAVADAWRLATTSRPLVLRGQALAFLLVVALATGSVAAVGASALGLFRATAPESSPSPSLPVPSPTVVPSPSIEPSPSPSPSPSVTPSVEPTDTAEPTETPEPTETAEATGTDDHGGNSGPGGGGGSGGNSGSGGGDDPSGDDHGGNSGKGGGSDDGGKGGDDHGGDRDDD